MFEHIVAIVDGSETSAFAVETAVTIAREAKSALSLCVTVDPMLEENGVGESPLTGLAAELSEGVLDAALARARAAGIVTAAGRLFKDGTTHAAVSYAREQGADLIVMGLAPRASILRPFFLSLAEEVLRETNVPLVVVRRSPPAKLEHRILVPIVDDDLSRAGVAYAIGLARRFAVTLVFCTIAGNGDTANASLALEHACADAAAAGVSASPLLVSGDDVSHAIVRNAGVQNCDCIIISSHVREGWPRFVRGSVTEAVFYASNVPVVIVRAPAAPPPSR